MRALALLALFLSSACEKREPAAGTPAAAPSCPDAEIKQRMDASFAAITQYFGEIEKLVPRWTDCELARTDLLALEPTAEMYMAEVMKTKAWGESLAAACKDRAKELGKSHPAAQQAQTRFDPLEPKVKEVLARCENHPGFQQAAGKGLRLLKKKK